MTQVRLEHINLDIKGKQILNDINFQIDDKIYCVFVGPSGCGKTVLLRIIAGLTVPTNGHVYFDDQIMDNIPASERNIAMTFQTYALYPNLTVEKNWEFPLYAEGCSQDEINQRIKQVSELLNMEPLMHRYPGELSGGQQQRVALGRSLVRQPTVYLHDEPMGNLDAKLRIELRASLKKIQVDMGITTVHVTHDQVEAQGLGDKLVVMDTGTIEQVGTPEEIYEKPANLYVAGFIGTPRMNFFDGSLVAQNGSLIFESPMVKLLLPGETRAELAGFNLEDKIRLGIRPEAIKVSPTEGAQAMPGKVYVTEAQSNEVIIDVLLDGDTHIKTRSAWHTLGFDPALDQTVYLDFDVSQLHLFDPERGKRIA